jgi:hypothetical protein
VKNWVYRCDSLTTNATIYSHLKLILRKFSPNMKKIVVLLLLLCPLEDTHNLKQHVF